MKSFFITLCACILCIVTPALVHATGYPLVATQTPTLISVTMSGLPNDTSTYELYDGTKAITNLPSTTPWTQQALGGQIVWQLTGANLVTNKTYSFHTKRLPKSTDIIDQKLEVTDVVLFTFGTATAPTTLLKSFAIDPTADRTVTVLGKIDTSLYPSTNNLKIDFYWSNTGTDKNGPSNAHLLSSGVNGQSQIATDGSYTLVVTDLTPSATYYFKQAISTSTGVTPVETKIGTFTAQKGYLAPGSVGESLDFNSRSYHLLAPWPGLSVLMDPDLCAQKKADGSVPQDAICDVNGFLNFAFKLLIGITAVVLVLRLMYEGYQYVVTDVPFLKASAKSDFKTALLGLLLALSAYIILNTINPKLVNNQITIDNVNLGIEDRLAVAFSRYTGGTGGPLSPDDIKKMRAQYGKAWDAVKTTYIPARDIAAPNASRGAKLLMTAQTTVEGYYPNTKSWRTNNPGNVGNTDNGAVAVFPTLDAGIKKQFEHLTRIVNGQNPAYKIGRVVKQGPVTDVATGITYPGINFTFDGSLHQYLKIYATGARKDNNYLSYVIAFFEKEGIKIDGYTKIADIYKMQ